jgi:hypothetical protein
MSTQKILIYSLVVLSVLLILANITLEVSTNIETKPIPEISKQEIEQHVSNLLLDYGIKSEWIKKVFVKKKLSDSLNYLFNVSLPRDISIPSLIKDLNNSFTDGVASVETIEKKNYSNTTVNIYSNNKLKLKAHFKHSKKIIREFSTYSFLVTTKFSDDSRALKSAKSIYYNFTYLITPSENALMAKKLLKGKYALLINDELSDTKYALEEDFSKQKLVNRIRSIIISFGRDKTYLIDKTSKIYNSKIYSLLRDEFQKRGIKIILLQNFAFLKGETMQELTSLFNFYSTSLKGKKGKVFVISFSDFLSLQPSIAKQIKLGDKIIEVDF